jgi:hypothetical protein
VARRGKNNRQDRHLQCRPEANDFHDPSPMMQDVTLGRRFDPAESTARRDLRRFVAENPHTGEIQFIVLF